MQKYSKLVKILFLIFILKYLYNCGFTGRKSRYPRARKTPLLDQVTCFQNSISTTAVIKEVNKVFNKERVWVSLSFCYTKANVPRVSSGACLKAVLSSRLYHTQTGD